MVQQVYTVVDRVAEESGPVFEAKNDGVALRHFRQMLEKNKVNMVEYRLLKIGAIDHDTHRFVVLDEPKEIFYDE